jgi:hypothetical protein
MRTMVGTVNLGRHEEFRVHAGEAATAGVARNVMLFFAAPFIGLAYIIVLPLVGTAAILKLAVRALI